MLFKPSLGLYRQGKKSPGVRFHLYGNRRGDALLALARAGMLPTRAHSMYSEGQGDKTCRKCGVYEENVKHVIFECNDAHFTEDDLLARLGLQEEIQDPSLVSTTNRTLENWEKESI